MSATENGSDITFEIPLLFVKDLDVVEGNQRTACRSKGRPSLEGTKNLQESILEAAFDHFIKIGFSGTSLDAVAIAAGVNKRTLYRYHSNKERLFHAAIRWKLDQFAMRFNERPEAGNELAFVQNVMRELLDFTLEPAVMSLMKVLIGESERFPDIVEDIALERSSRFPAVMEAALQALMDAGQLRALDPALVRKTLFFSICAEAWMPHMFGLNVLDTPEKRDAHFEERWKLFLKRYAARRRRSVQARA
jgi:AcrR family transcriptional regulator